MADSKTLARMVICTGVSIDSIRKDPYEVIPNAFYDLVEVFYYNHLIARLVNK